MRMKLEELLALQTLQFDQHAKPAEVKARREHLKATFPEVIVAHYERMTSRGRKCVAIARAGVCSECHLVIPTGTLGALPNDEILHQCDNCGRYLYLPKDPSAGVPKPQAATPAPGRSPQRRSRRSPLNAL